MSRGSSVLEVVSKHVRSLVAGKSHLTSEPF
jgi:hypothetical protein